MNNITKTLKVWTSSARKEVKNIKSALLDNCLYVHGRLADGRWIRIVDAKSNRGDVLGKTLDVGGLKWEEINQWEQR